MESGYVLRVSGRSITEVDDLFCMIRIVIPQVPNRHMFVVSFDIL